MADEFFSFIPNDVLEIKILSLAYSRVAFAKLYFEKTAITAADILNDRIVPFFDQHNIVTSSFN